MIGAMTERHRRGYVFLGMGSNCKANIKEKPALTSAGLLMLVASGR